MSWITNCNCKKWWEKAASCFIGKNVFSHRHYSNVFMTQSNLEAVRQAIIKAVPSIMELKFGCEVNIGGTKSTFVKWDKRLEYGGYFHTKEDLTMYPDDLIQIILGRPIRLADVLYANQQRCSVEDPEMDDFALFDRQETIIGDWNLLEDNLSKQSEECIAYLASILLPNHSL